MWRVKLFSSAFQNLTFLPISFFKKKISSSTQDYRWAHNQIQPMKHCQSPKRIQTFKKKMGLCQGVALLSKRQRVHLTFFFPSGFVISVNDFKIRIILFLSSGWKGSQAYFSQWRWTWLLCPWLQCVCDLQVALIPSIENLFNGREVEHCLWSNRAQPEPEERKKAAITLTALFQGETSGEHWPTTQYEKRPTKKKTFK